MVANTQLTELAALIGAVLDEFQPVLGSRRIELAFQAPEEQIILDIDPDQIKQVFRNLLSNASRFTPAGGAIHVGIDSSDSRVQVLVRDDGVGIPSAELETIFEKFAQSSRTRSGAGGTGLGLAICREIVELHCGRVWAQNAPGAGAVLVVELPRTPRETEVAHAG
jgi:signal transduction histidine kinase